MLFFLARVVFALDENERDMRILATLDPMHEAPYRDGFEKDRKRLMRHKANERTINRPNRYFELGFGVDLALSNNTIRLDDILKKSAIFDLEELNDRINDKGFFMDFTMLPNFFINLNLKNGVHVGIETGVEAYGSINLSKDLFNLLGEGNSINKKISLDMDGTGDAFFFVNLAVGFDFLGFHLEIKPAAYLPVIHALADRTGADFKNGSDGSMHGSAHADFSVYSCFNLEELFGGGMGSSTIMDGIKIGSWGFDLESSLEHKIVKNLFANIYSRIPIWPGTMGYSMDERINMQVDIDPLTNNIYDDERGDHTDATIDTDVGDVLYKKVTEKLHRPFRIGTEIVYKPLDHWFTFGALIGCGVKNPYTSDLHAFVEYCLTVNSDIYIKNYNIMSFHFSSSYINELFKHSFLFRLNFRVLEFNIGVSACSHNFVQSFYGAGLGASFSFSFGF